MKALAIIGYHRTGKTTVATTLIKELTKQGYNVCSIKDIHSEAFRCDTEGKNTRNISRAKILPVKNGGLRF